MEKTLSIAMSRSDRTNEILSGRAQLAPFSFDLQSTMVEEIFERQVSEEACYDIAEMSLASYLIGLDRGNEHLTAIPVFLSRSFRHNAIYVKADSPWQHPSELKNRRFGLPEFQMTAAVWVRAYFRHEWGIPLEEMNWVTYRPERIPIETPAEKSSTENIFDALVDGEIDAIMTARRPPEQYFDATGKKGAIRRLFPSVWDEEREYYKRTGVFPIMHLVSLKREMVEKYPAVPKQLYDLMLKVKNNALANLFETIKHETAIPWSWEAAEKSAELMGSDLWPYGLQKNWSQIASFMEFLKEDGLIKNTFSKEEVFAPGVLDT